MRIRTLALALLCAMPLLLAATRAGADIAITAIGVLFLLRCAIDKEWHWLRQPETILLGFLWVYLLCNSWLLADHANALRTTVWVRFLVFFTAVTTWLLTSADTLKTATRWGLVILVLLMIDTYWQYAFGISLSRKTYPAASRLGGPMSHPNIGNMLLKISLPMVGITWYWITQAGKKHYGYFLAAYAFILVVLILLTGERSTAMLMLLAFSVLAAIFSYHTPTLRLTILMLIAAFCILLSGMIYTQPVVSERAHYLVDQLSNFEDSPYGQLFLSGWHIFLTHPIFGIGPGGFFELCPHIQLQFNLTYCDVHPHNIYLQLLSETGLAGFILFIACMAAIIQKTISSMAFTNNRHIISAFSLTALAVLFFPVMVTQSIFSNWPASLFWYSLSLAICAPRIAKP